MGLDLGRRRPNSNLSFRSRNPEISAGLRLDPMHDMRWHDTVGIRWSDISLKQKTLKLSPNGTLVHAVEQVWSPLQISQSRQYSPLAIKTYAILSQFHQATTIQIAALLGVSARKATTAINSLYSIGVLEQAGMDWSFAEDDDRPLGGSGPIWRIDHVAKERRQEWLSGLSDLEYLLLSGGRDLLKGTNSSTSAGSIRHNLSQLEICIKAMESCDSVIGTWGEPQTSGHLFTDIDGMRQNIADAAIVLKDGSIIIIETSGKATVDDQTGNKLVAKAAAWGAIAAKSDLDMKILFVNINPKLRMNRLEYKIMQGGEEVANYLSSTALQDKGKRSLFYANAYDWFPMASAVTEGFEELEAVSIVDKRYHSLAPKSIDLNTHSDPVINTLAALHTPEWINSPVGSLFESVA